MRYYWNGFIFRLKKLYHSFINDYNADYAYESSVYESLLHLQEKYEFILLDIKNLEQENIETTNCLYEIMNSMEQIKIDIHNIHPVIYNITQKTNDV